MKKLYTGEKRREICFPIGGIGSGCIGLDGTGRLRDWEIFNRPSKGSINGFSHFGVKAEADGKTIDARIMNADLMESYMGRIIPHSYEGYGKGPTRNLLSGVPHFRDSEFLGEFPMGEVRFVDETFPGGVKLEAFNPFIPSNPDDSSIPAAFFTAEVRNTTDRELTYTFELSVNNPLKHEHLSRLAAGEHFRGVELYDDFDDADSPEYGRLVFGVPASENVQIQQHWYRGEWFDNLQIFWQNFTAPGVLQDRVYDDARPGDDIATVAVRATVAPGECWRQRFLIGWYVPNYVNYWSTSKTPEEEAVNRKPWKNYYATMFADAKEVAEYAFREWDRLEDETIRFRDALYGSSLPEAAMDAVGANLAVLKSPTVLRLTNGEFYGFEGCSSDFGSCEGSCTHVWNYTFALPFLFPSLERSMRELDFTYNQGEDGGMAFRLLLPLGKGRSGFRPCVDGQMGGLIKTYREWKLCGDDEWLRRWWPKVKKSLEYAWAPTNADRWDPERSGVITGRQHHTLDMELFGPNAWLNAFYIGALTAGAEMAEAMGDLEDAKLYRELAKAGREFTDHELFNGEYYVQKVDIRDKSVLDPFIQGNTSIFGTNAAETYWSDEAKQLKYQIAGGCGVDQVLAQWMCELSGVGEILDPAHVDSALAAIYRHNFKPSLRFHFNPCRIYGLNDDAGLVICDWPEGVEKPIVPIPYAEEVMHGFEYQAGIHMIMHGMEEEGLNVVRGVRDRYDGEKRNPWNEMECGSNYARSMASYALLLAYSGFRYDMRKGRMGMLPMHDGQYFWSLDGAWGTFRCDSASAELSVLYGELKLREWVLPGAEKVAGVSVDGAALPFAVGDDAVMLDGEVVLKAGAKLKAEY